MGFNASAAGMKNMKTEAQSIDEIEFNTVEHSVRVTVQMINRKINPDIESEIALVAVHKAKVLAQLENITLGTYQSKKNDGKHIVVIQCDDEDDVSSAFDKLDQVLASFNNPNYEVYVNEW